MMSCGCMGKRILFFNREYETGVYIYIYIYMQAAFT